LTKIVVNPPDPQRANAVLSDPSHFEAPQWHGYLFLLAGMAVVGSYVALAKPLTAVFPVFLLAWMRFFISAIAMYSWTKRQPADHDIDAASHRLLFTQSFFGNFLFSICMLYGVSQTTASASGVILATIPAAVAILSWFWLKEKISLRVWIAIFISVAGLAVLSLSKPAASAGKAEMSLVGNLLIIASVWCESIYVILAKKLTNTLTPQRISALINLWGLLLMTPFGLWQAMSFKFGAVPSSAWALLIFYSLAASMISTWLWMTGAKTVPANRSGVFTVAMPVTATLIGIFVFGEPFTSAIGFAFVCAIASIALITTSPITNPSAKTKPITKATRAQD
jgi:drug/metabolite transporter (DMT)-like permease